MAIKPESKKYYVAPITLGFTPSDGDLIGGTINGVEVNGQWIGGSKFVILYRGGNADTYRGNNTNVPFCTIGFRNKKAVISLEQDSAPTTDYELHLYRYVPASIVQIPQEYVEGLEAMTANANQALERATAAQSTADTAKSTADTAKSTADTAKSTANTAKSTADTAKSTANTAKSMATEAESMAESAATKINPEFTGSFSQNRKSDTNIGKYSHAEGFSTTASEHSAHAEGSMTIASGTQSHAEGTLTIASGDVSHVEGYHTIAQGQNQHVEGTYNIPSGERSAYTGDDYVHIVGNGKTENLRSNAHTLTWSGVPWYQGRPQFGGNAMNDGAKTVFGNGDKEIILSSSTPDSTKKFKITVDDTGTISATEVTT